MGRGSRRPEVLGGGKGAGPESGGNKLMKFISVGNLMDDCPKLVRPEETRPLVLGEANGLAPGVPKVLEPVAVKALPLDPGKGDRKVENWLLEDEGLEADAPLLPRLKNELEDSP